jgi:hypothetical protein
VFGEYEATDAACEEAAFCRAGCCALKAARKPLKNGLLVVIFGSCWSGEDVVDVCAYSPVVSSINLDRRCVLSSNVAGPPALLSCMAVQAPTLKTDLKQRFGVGHDK